MSLLPGAFGWCFGTCDGKRINEGWAVDFVSDWVVNEQSEKVRIINVMDECSRQALWTQAYTSIKARKLTEILDKIIDWRGKPAYIRFSGLLRNGQLADGRPAHHARWFFCPSI